MRKANAKVILSAVLSAAIGFTGTLTGCGKSTGSSSSASVNTKGINMTGVPLVQDKQTLTVATQVIDGQPSNNDVQFWKTLETQTNVHINWVETMASAWTDKKNIAVAANDQPDAYLGAVNFTDDDLINLGTSGKFIDITKYIDTCMPNLAAYLKQNPDWKKAITTPEGKIYAAPSIATAAMFKAQYPFFVNQDLLKNLSLSFTYDAKTPMTASQFQELLTAFKTQDPNKNGKADEIPWSSLANDLGYWSASFGIIYANNAATPAGPTSVYISNGKVVSAVQQSGFKDYVKWLNGLWNAGLMDPETFTQSSNVYNSKLNTKTPIVGYTDLWRTSGGLTSYVLDTPVKASATENAAVQQYYSVGITRASFVVTSACKNPALALRWVDNLYTPDNSIQLNTAQLLGEHISKNDDGTYQQIRAIDWNKEGEYNLCPGNDSRISILTKETYLKQKTLPAVAVQKYPYDDALSSFFPTKFSLYPNTVWMTASDTKKNATSLSDINPYILSTFAKWVTKGGVDAEWSSFQTTLKNMGIDDVVSTYQKYYEKVK